MPLMLGGQNLGEAHGKITIDTSDAKKAVGTMNTVGRDIEKSMSSASLGIKNVQRSLGEALSGSLSLRSQGDKALQELASEFTATGKAAGGFGDSIRAASSRAITSLSAMMEPIQKMRMELLALTAASSVGFAFGYGSARDVRAYRIAFKTLLGDFEKADALMEELSDQANMFGQNVNDVYGLARVLLPTLKDGAESLDEWVSRAARIATLVPENARYAARAIQEYLAGQTISLQRVFNVEASLIQEAENAYADLGDQIDYILEKRGATEEAALASADAWRGVRNELRLVVSTGFEPLFTALQPILRGLTSMLSTLRDTSPALLTIGSAMIGIVAVGAPLLLFLSQVISSLETIQELNIGSTLGRVGIVAGSAVGAVAGATFLTQGIGRVTGDERLEEATWQDVLATAIKAIIDMLTLGVLGFLEVIGIAGDALTRFSATVLDVTGQLLNTIDEFTGGAGTLGDGLRQLADNLRANEADNTTERAEGYRKLFDAANNLKEGVDKFFGLGDSSSSGVVGPGGAEQPPTPLSLPVNPMLAGPIMSMIRSNFAEFATMERDAQQAVIDEMVDYMSQREGLIQEQGSKELSITEEYESKRAETIAKYEQAIARDAEDFARQRQRDNEQLERDIAKIRADATDDEADWQQERDDKIAKLREDSANKQIDIERDYNRKMLELQSDHRITLMEAASRLDARAISQENRRYGAEVNKLSSGVTERTQVERAALQDRIRQEIDAHKERLENARDADEERIEDMREALAERQRIEDEDRAIKLQRMEQDHQAQLAQMQQANASKLVELHNQQVREREQLWNAHVQRMADLGVQNQQWASAQAIAQSASLSAWVQYWTDWNNAMSPASPPSSTTYTTGSSSSLYDTALESRLSGIKRYQSGGDVPSTGLAMLHANEFVLNPETTATLRSMVNPFSQNSLVSAVAGGGGSRVQVGEINITIPDAPGHTPGSIAIAVRDELITAFRELSK